MSASRWTSKWIVVWLLQALFIAGCATSTPKTENASPDYRALVQSPDRSDADRETDTRRKPERLLAFMGVKSGMKALDVAAGGGYTTELLARAVGPQGVVYAQNRQPRDAFDERIKKPAMRNVVRVIRPFDDPLPPEVKGLDLATIILSYHDLTYLGVDRAAMNRKIFEALKPGGHFVVVDHSARPGDGTSVGQTTHRIEESALRREVEAAGFKLEAQSDFLRNPEDPRTENYRDMKTPSDKFALKFLKPDA